MWAECKVDSFEYFYFCINLATYFGIIVKYSWLIGVVISCINIKFKFNRTLINELICIINMYMVLSAE